MRAVSLPEEPLRYFEPSAGMRMVPISRLHPTKPHTAQVASVDRAELLMEQAAKGERPRRQPISVRAQSDGTYAILDGNATYAVALRSGWHALPAIVVS